MAAASMGGMADTHLRGLHQRRQDLIEELMQNKYPRHEAKELVRIVVREHRVPRNRARNTG